jgi:Protein of unknown function (DUF3617)
MVLRYLRRASGGLLLLVGLLVVFAAGPRADTPAAAGDLWEVTAKMSMEGLPMQMPAQTHKVCAAKVWTGPPAGDNAPQKCTRSEYTVTGDKVTWTETCESPPMTGKGEITRQGSDAYTGSIKYSSKQGTMTINLTGHIVGSCDNPS